MLRKFLLAAYAIVISLVSFGQTASVPSDSTVNPTNGTEKAKPILTISGSADVYYKYDFAKTKANTYTSFTGSHNNFALGMASVKFEHKGDKVGAVLDLGFGPRAAEFSYNDDGIMQTVKQLYITYSSAESLKFTAGTWATHVGYELVDPQLNRNYSMSYMFTNGPFTHTGLKADFTKGKHGFMLGVSNATDFRMSPDGQINKKFVIAQYSLAATDNIKLYLNYVGGKGPDTAKINQFDLVATAKISDKFSIGYNGTVHNTQFWDGSKNMDGLSWWGSALYLNVDPQSWLGFTLRGEYFSDKNHLKFAMAPSSKGCSIFATTLSANIKTGGFIFVPEFRVDNSNELIFVDKTGAGKKSDANFVLAAIYSF